MPEADLYTPVKQFLESQGYEVKGEVGPCDVVAVRGEEGPIVVELKKRLTLALVLQAVDRLSFSDVVYVAFPSAKGNTAWRRRKKAVLGLLRRLGLGLLIVTEDGVVPVLDPGPYRPRLSKRRRARLLKEFHERVGDPETGGSAPGPRLTAYRQDAIRCGQELLDAGALKLSLVRERAGVSRAGPIMRDNHYGWFERVERGTYTLTPRGEEELERWLEVLEGRSDPAS